MKHIKLSQNGTINKGKYIAKVDNRDYDWLNQHYWAVKRDAVDGLNYAVRRNGNTYEKMHNAILIHQGIDLFKKETCNHLNGNGLDNRFKNLEPATPAMQAICQRNKNSNTSKVPNVHWHKQQKKWCSSIQRNKIRYTVGSFSTKEEARIALKAFKELYNF
jgi:hypothetical protein